MKNIVGGVTFVGRFEILMMVRAICMKKERDVSACSSADIKKVKA